jgi:hypothetical protein
MKDAIKSYRNMKITIYKSILENMIRPSTVDLELVLAEAATPPPIA